MPININYPNFLAAPIQESPAATLFENLLKGYKIGQEPARMAAEAKDKALATQLKQLQAEHLPKQYELSDEGLRLANSMKAEALKYLPRQRELNEQKIQAEIDKAKRGPEIKGALYNAMRIRASYPPGSQEWNEANDYINKLKAPREGIQVTNSPEGGFEVNIGGQASGTTIPGIGKLKPGETVVYDKDKKPIGVNTRLSDKEVKQSEGREQFNVVYPFLNESLSALSGKGSWNKFKHAVDTYSTDPASKQLVDNYFAAQNLLSVGTVTENARIGGNATNQQLKLLRKTLQSSEVPAALEKYGEFKLPEGYAAASNDIFLQKLNEMADAAENNVPLWRFRSINATPSEQKKATTALSGALSKSDQDKAKAAAKAHYLSLTPEQRKAYRLQHLGGK